MPPPQDERRQPRRRPVGDPMTESTESLFGMLANVPKLTEALCRGRAPHWDNPDDDPAVERLLVDQCRICPALPNCRAWVASLPPSQIPLGVTAAVMRRPRKPRRSRATRADAEHQGDDEEINERGNP
jgi:hypothetical protein